MGRKFFWIAALFLLFTTQASAGWDKRPELRWKETYTYDDRENVHNAYTNRFSATFNYLNADEESQFKITPYYELVYYYNKGFAGRNQVGLEVGKDFFSWLYAGQAFQYGYMKEDFLNKYDFVSRYFTQSVTRMLLTVPLLSMKYLTLKGYALEEFTYDMSRGGSPRNDATAGLLVPICKYVETNVQWRHTKRINHYDSDFFEGSLTLVF